MKIIKCPNCGHYIHDAEVCFHCGSKEGFQLADSPQPHPRAAANLRRAEDALKAERFDEVAECADRALEWMPDAADVFWLRLLARKKCTSALALLSKGFAWHEDPDFCRALECSAGAEQSVYTDIRETAQRIQTALVAAIADSRCRIKANARLPELEAQVRQDVELQQQTIFSLWSQLRDTEQKMHAVAFNCEQMAEEPWAQLRQATKSMDNILLQVAGMTECSREEFESYQAELEQLRLQSERGRQAIADLMQHPIIQTFAELTARQQQQLQAVEQALEVLQNALPKAQETAQKVEHLELAHSRVLQAVKVGKFMEAVGLLGGKGYRQVLQAAGLRAEVPTDICPENQEAYLLDEGWPEWRKSEGCLWRLGVPEH